MPDFSKANRPPKYGLHKASGNARVTLGGRDIYLGESGTGESLEAYQALIAEWRRKGRQGELVGVGGDGATIDELVAGYAAGLGVEVIDVGTCLDCAADANGDGMLNVLDFVAFQVLWQDQDPAADCDGNEVFNVLDFVCFQQRFVQGCG